MTTHFPQPIWADRVHWATHQRQSAGQAIGISCGPAYLALVAVSALRAGWARVGADPRLVPGYLGEDSQVHRRAHRSGVI